MPSTIDVALYADILDAAVEAVAADAGSIQVVDEERQGLRLVASRGFHPASADFWAFISPGTVATCSTALGIRERVVVPDVEAVAAFAGSADLREWRRSRLRAVQSTPLVALDGRVLGMLSTHWRAPHRPSDEELGAVDQLVPLADPDRLAVRCAWCGMLETGGGFLPQSEVVFGLRLLRDRVSHGICPDCLNRELHAAAAARDADEARLLKHAVLHQINSDIRQAGGQAPTAPTPDATWDFVCECGRHDCDAFVQLTRDEFDALRAAEAAVLAGGHALGRGAEARHLARDLRDSAIALKAQAQLQQARARKNARRIP